MEPLWRNHGLARRIASLLGRMLGRSVALAEYPYRLAQRAIGRRRAPLALPVLSAAELAAEDGLTKLAAALADRDPATRTLALEVICEFSKERAARLISSMLHDPAPRVRAAAAAAAERLNATGTVFSLILTLEDADPSVRAAARDAIESITGRNVDLEAQAEGAERRRALEELKRWWKEQRVAELEREMSV